MKFNQLLKSGLQFLNKYSPQILAGVGVTTSVTAFALAIPATVKATKAIEKKKEELGRDLTKSEKFVEGWKFYIVPVILEGLAVTCVVGSCAESTKRLVILASSLALKENQIEEVKKQVLEKFGKNKAMDVLGSAMQVEADKSDKTIYEARYPNNENTSKVTYSEPRPLWFDSLTGHWFRAKETEVQGAINNINYELNSSMGDKALNDLYYELGLPTCLLGEQHGWQGGHDIIKFKIDPEDGPVIYEPTGEAARVFNVNCRCLL